MPRRAPKHHDYTIAQWPDDLLSNFDMLSTPYLCCACKRPCKSIKTLRTHKCQTNRERSNA